jgi:hypothetical protein
MGNPSNSSSQEQEQLAGQRRGCPPCCPAWARQQTPAAVLQGHWARQPHPSSKGRSNSNISSGQVAWPCSSSWLGLLVGRCLPALHQLLQLVVA